MKRRPRIIRKAVAAAGGVWLAGIKCDVTYQAVQKWIKAGQVPALRVIALEIACEGKVTRHELRPDIYPSETAAQA